MLDWTGLEWTGLEWTGLGLVDRLVWLRSFAQKAKACRRKREPSPVPGSVARSRSQVHRIWFVLSAASVAPGVQELRTTLNM